MENFGNCNAHLLYAKSNLAKNAFILQLCLQCEINSFSQLLLNCWARMVMTLPKDCAGLFALLALTDCLVCGKYIAAVSCNRSAYMLGGVKMGIW